MKLLIITLTIFLIFSSIVFAQSFKDKAIFSPDIAFLWNFQRGVEEVYRFVKFTPTMRVQYSLELGERRIGEIEVLESKNKSNIVPMVENSYELELDKIQTSMNATDILSRFISPMDIKENVTQRLQYNNKILGYVLKNSTSSTTKTSLANAIKKTTACIDAINKL